MNMKVLTKMRMRAYYRDTFATPIGREVLMHIMSHGFITRSTFVAGDPNQTLLNEGSRRLALSILNQAVKSESELQELIQEKMNENS